MPLGRRIERLGRRAPRRRSGSGSTRRSRRSIDKARARAPRRRPAIAYPPELPVAAARDEIAAAIREHQVVIVCGETGSGKTTQMPKICLDARARRRAA